MLKIRLQRVGRIHEPSFRLVVTESKNSTKSGKCLEVLGNYDSRHGQDAKIKTDRVTYWMSKGAQMSDTVHNLLVDRKIITGKKINKLPLKNAIKKEAPTVEVKPTEETQQETESAPVENVTEQVAEKVSETPVASAEVESVPEPVVEETPVA